MKKKEKILSVLLMATMLVFTLAACGNNGGSESKVNGNTYIFDSYTLNGEDATEIMKSMYSEQSFSFKDDGVCVQTIIWADEMAEAMGTDPVEQTGTYEESGDTVKVAFKVDGESDTEMEFAIDADTLKLVEEGSTIVYVKK